MNTLHTFPNIIIPHNYRYAIKNHSRIVKDYSRIVKDWSRKVHILRQFIQSFAMQVARVLIGVLHLNTDLFE